MADCSLLEKPPLCLVCPRCSVVCREKEKRGKGRKKDSGHQCVHGALETAVTAFERIVQLAQPNQKQ